ncbi:MAG: CIA30 family protein [Bacteroidota bacterium]
MSFLIILSLFISTMEIDFSSKKTRDWGTVNDGVMGGLSIGRSNWTQDGLLFFGSVSLENNGGFASIRGPYGKFDLSTFDRVKITYRSEGMNIAFQLNQYQQFYLPNYKINLPVSKDWTELSYDLKELKQYRMGNPTGQTIEEKALGQIIRLGFITNEKRAGDFKFEVQKIVFE